MIRTALVTGASSGFGAAIARAFGELGWRIAIGARRSDKLLEVKREVEKAGGQCFAQELDIRVPDSLDAFCRSARDTLGPVDVAVSNAGVGFPAQLIDARVEDLRNEIDTNLLGPMLLAQQLLPSMLERKTGDLVFVSSLNSVSPRPFQAGYSASKAGVEALARVLQMELEGTGVRATIVRPGPSQTEMGQSWDPKILKPMLESWKRWGVLRHHGFLRPESIATAVVSAVTAPPGTHLDLIQVNPEAPIEEEARLDTQTSRGSLGSGS